MKGGDISFCLETKSLNVSFHLETYGKRDTGALEYVVERKKYFKYFLLPLFFRLHKWKKYNIPYAWLIC